MKKNPWEKVNFDEKKIICPNDIGKLSEYDKYQKKLKKTNEYELNLELIPEPYIGNLETCSLLILLANPGIAKEENAGHDKEEMRSYGKRNLLQIEIEWPFYLLAPGIRKFAGGKYWLKRLSWLTKYFEKKYKMTEEEALQKVAQKVAVAELHPYHSKEIHKTNMLYNLPSSKFTYSCVKEAITRGCNILIARSLSEWEKQVELPRSFFMLRSSQSDGVIQAKNLVIASNETITEKSLLCRKSS